MIFRKLSVNRLCSFLPTLQLMKSLPSPFESVCNVAESVHCHWQLLLGTSDDLWCWFEVLCHLFFSIFSFTRVYLERFAIRAHCSGVKGRIRQVGPRSAVYDVILGPDSFLLAGHAKATSVPANRKPAFSPVPGMILFVGPARQKEKSPFSVDCSMCCIEVAF